MNNLMYCPICDSDKIEINMLYELNEVYDSGAAYVKYKPEDGRQLTIDCLNCGAKITMQFSAAHFK